MPWSPRGLVIVFHRPPAPLRSARRRQSSSDLSEPSDIVLVSHRPVFPLLPLVFVRSGWESSSFATAVPWLPARSPSVHARVQLRSLQASRSLAVACACSNVGKRACFSHFPLVSPFHRCAPRRRQVFGHLFWLGKVRLGPLGVELSFVRRKRESCCGLGLSPLSTAVELRSGEPPPSLRLGLVLVLASCGCVRLC